MKHSANVKCPLCGFEERLVLEPGFQRILCDVEVGGCDEYYCVEMKLRPEIKVFRLVDVTIPDYEDFND